MTVLKELTSLVGGYSLIQSHDPKASGRCGYETLKEGSQPLRKAHSGEGAA